MKKAVLCVHDEKLMNSLKKRLIDDGFAEILVCDSAGEAVCMALERVPTAMVLAARCPGSSELAAVARMRERSELPIILITQRCNADEAAAAAEAGVSAVLTEPLRDEELDAALQVATANARRLQAAKEEVASLREQIESRKLVEKAKGRLMERDKLSEAEAFRRMQRLAMDRRISMRQLAEAILLTDRISG